MKEYIFEAEVLKNGELDAAYIEFPYDAFTEFGAKGQVKVFCSINGYEFRGCLAKMNHQCHFIGLNKEVRKLSGVKFHDIVNVKIWKDDLPRIVEIPEEFGEILIEYELLDFFEKMSYTHKKEHIDYIYSAKKEETKLRRIEKSIQMLIKFREEKLSRKSTLKF